jgi:hypothetical protein
MLKRDNFSDGRGKPGRWLAYPPLLISMLFSPTGFAQEKREFDCKPEVKYECTAEQCERVIEEFEQAQHPQSFSYNAKTNELSACLWTNCYSAKTRLFQAKTGGVLTAIGKLTPVVHPKNIPLIVSLTIKTGHKENQDDHPGDNKIFAFTAVWGYAGDRLTFDMGSCTAK